MTITITVKRNSSVSRNEMNNYFKNGWQDAKNYKTNFRNDFRALAVMKYFYYMSYKRVGFIS